MILREDEMEALLKLDGAVLSVTKNTVVPDEYSAIITQGVPAKHFARTSESRADAVLRVWEVYQRYMSPPPKHEDSPEWVEEEVRGSIENTYIKLLQEKQNG
jgi:hypothetical protein